MCSFAYVIPLSYVLLGCQTTFIFSHYTKRLIRLVTEYPSATSLGYIQNGPACRSKLARGHKMQDRRLGPDPAGTEALRAKRRNEPVDAEPVVTPERARHKAATETRT